MNPFHLASVRTVPLLTLTVVLISGCASIQVVQHHPQQRRLEHLLARLSPHTANPQTHYWVRVLQPTDNSADLWILHDGHFYFSESLANQADDKIITALLAHGVAHYELHHHTKRGLVQSFGILASAVGGFFVPGLQAASLATTPATEGLMSAGQEFTADARTLTYLNSLGYSIDDYADALQFLVAHAYTERTGSIMTTQQGFSRRITALRESQTAQPTTAP